MSRRSRQRARPRMAPSLARPRLRGKVGWGRVRDDRAAVTSIEFAIAGPIFLLFALMILDVSLELATLASLDSATLNAARLIRIGTITGSGYSATLASDICNGVVLIPSCTSNIQIYVAAAPSTGASGTSAAGTGFANVSLATASSGTMTSTKATLAANDDVILQVGYNRPFSVTWLARVIGSSAAMLMSTAVFQTEPY